MAHAVSKTPCVIIETCVIQDAHNSVIAADPNIIPESIARGICKAFGVAFDPVASTHDYKNDLLQIKSIVDNGGKWYQRFTNTQKIQKVLATAGL